MTPATDRQSFWLFVALCAAVALWLIFSPGILWIIDTIANGAAR